MSGQIHDGPVWCEACQRWFTSMAEYQRHRWHCPNRTQQVDYRDGREELVRKAS